MSVAKGRRRGRAGSKRGGVLEGITRRMARGGDGIVETPEGEIYVRGALPGDRVRVGGVDRRGKVLLGQVLEVLEPSADRREPPCTHAEACGGCAWMGWSTEAQRAEKATRVAALLGVERIPIVTGAELGYRRRTRLAWSRRGGVPRLGYRGAREHAIVDVERCVVLAAPIARALQAIRDGLLAALEGEGELSIARRDDGAVVALRTDVAQPPAVYAAARALVDAPGGPIRGVALFVEGGAPALLGDPRERTLGADGLPLEGTIGGFSQAHDELNDVLARAVHAQAGAGACARVLELHAGHGNLGVLLAKEAEAYVAVELDADAARIARENFDARGLRSPKVKVVEGDAGSYPRGDWDVVVLDPPRTGAREVVERLTREPVPAVVYVSCDPTTLARDLDVLRRGGYEVTHATAYDLFPQTPHVETLVRMRRVPR
ncbi:MAG: class I SAM-dependent RNA methyltransferase [Myxococcales bacterium]|nr:class I SAM-dependent RNA methyltransferase [Myxococcales bacterium]